jgi:hypothetical protein
MEQRERPLAEAITMKKADLMHFSLTKLMNNKIFMGKRESERDTTAGFP